MQIHYISLDRCDVTWAFGTADHGYPGLPHIFATGHILLGLSRQTGDVGEAAAPIYATFQLTGERDQPRM